MPELHPTEVVSISDLQAHPRNYREHPDDQLAHIERSLRDHGFYRNVVVARDNTILAGHGVVEAARRQGATDIPVIRLDLDPDSVEALKVLTGDNHASALAIDDDRMLAEMLREIREDPGNDAGLLGTGFDERQLATFLMVTRQGNEIPNFDAAAEWAGADMPVHDPGAENIMVNIRFTSEEERTALLAHLGVEDRNINRRSGHISFWWPLRDEQQDLASVEVQSGGEDAA